MAKKPKHKKSNKPPVKGETIRRIIEGVREPVSHRQGVERVTPLSKDTAYEKELLVTKKPDVELKLPPDMTGFPPSVKIPKPKRKR